jgi:hypothetical protein
LIVFSTLCDATFWPTIIIESKTNCKKVCATQETITIESPDAIAFGRDMRAIAAKR